MTTTTSSRVGFMEEAFIISGLIGVQIILAVYLLLVHRFLALGINSIFLVIFGGITGAFFFLPFALVLEKKKWPTKLTPMLMVQMIIISIAGVAFQALMLIGIKMTSPAIASTMPNLAPVIIFVIAACFRLEKFAIQCKYSRAKVLGTVVCLGGAIAMSFLMSPPASPKLTTSVASSAKISKEWILGSFYLLSAVVFLSCSTVLQAVTMLNFPAPFSLCAVTALMGSLITALMQFIMEGRLDAGSSTISLTYIIAIVLLGAVVTSVCVGFQAWCVNKKGPVMVSIFSPIQTVCSAILSAVFLRQVISLGSLGGMLLMFVGLYVVLWAKKKEGCNTEDAIDKISRDIEKPLLS